VPDQDVFVPLSSLGDGETAVVRLYAAPLPPIGLFVIHPWFVVKRPDAESFDRWEVWMLPSEPFGHVRKNMLEPEADFGVGEAFAIAELTGPEAEPVITFIEQAPETYPCAHTYVLVPGPNSATFVQWVLDNTSWDVPLPPTAIGDRAAPLCVEHGF